MDVTKTRTQNVKEKMIVYGAPGMWKSTFASQFPKAIFVNANDGLEEVDAQALPRLRTLKDLYDQLDWLKNEKHGYKTVIVDTLNDCQSLIKTQIAQDNGWTLDQCADYGRWLKNGINHWWLIANKLDLIRQHGINVILICHQRKEQFKNPLGEDYIRYNIALEGDLATDFWVGWASTVLFVRRPVEVKKDGKFDKGKGTSSGDNVVAHTQWNAGFEAKNRSGLPPIIPFAYEDYIAHKKNGEPVQPTQSAEFGLATMRVRQLMKAEPESSQKKIRERLKGSTDIDLFHKMIDHLESRAEERAVDAATHDATSPKD